MAIIFECKCGRPLRANPDVAGKRTKCPECGMVLTVPTQSTTGPGAKPPSTPPAEEDPFAPTIDWSLSTTPEPAIPEIPRIGPINIKVDASVADGPSIEIPRTEDGSLQYRVLTQKDQGFTGKFSATKLEEVLNAHARHGWSLKSAVTIQIPGHGGHHDELIVILER